jgi:hypothetical protein
MRGACPACLDSRALFEVGHVAVGVAMRAALQRRMPSMIEAWLSASEMIASSSPSRVSNRPPLASKHDAVEDRVLGAEEARERRLELLVQRPACRR